MTKLYRPSNGTEGMIFTSNWCDKCRHQINSKEGWTGCHKNIDLNAMMYNVDDPEYPKEWLIDMDGRPACTVYHNRNDYNVEQKLKRKRNSKNLEFDYE